MILWGLTSPDSYLYTVLSMVVQYERLRNIWDIFCLKFLDTLVPIIKDLLYPVTCHSYRYTSFKFLKRMKIEDETTHTPITHLQGDTLVLCHKMETICQHNWILTKNKTFRPALASSSSFKCDAIRTTYQDA